MDVPARKTKIYTVGLEAENQRLLDKRFSPFPQFEFSHHRGWSPDILDSHVIVVDLDSPVSRDALDMMREFKGAQEPLLVLYSSDDDRLSGQPMDEAPDHIPGLCRRLRDVLPNIDCSQAATAVASRAALTLVDSDETDGRKRISTAN